MEKIVISANEANELTKNSRDKSIKEKEKASNKFLKERIGPAIKEYANNGKNEISIH